MGNIENINSIICSLSGMNNFITTPTIYVKICGDLNSAILLNQIIYWSDKTKRKDGFFYKTYKEWEDEICLSQYQVKKSIDNLERLGLVETKLHKANGSPTKHYKPNFENLKELMFSYHQKQSVYKET